jgi:hypothetical protein
MRRPLQLGVLVALVFMGSAGLAEEQASKQAPMTDRSERLGQNDQQAGRPMMAPGVMPGRIGPGPGTMQAGVGPGMPQSGVSLGMMQAGIAPGAGAMFGSRVTPMMNLSAEDVRSYLGLQLDRLHNKRLKVGEVKVEADTITADVVTVDDSLVQQLKVDRHTGTIEFEN